ncbi:MAG: glycogen synthase GlgA [Rickettsiales bacterium]|jgi:starch synthase|nr:glycogen synthase GlgA [Rickettsiales bacterium]
MKALFVTSELHPFNKTGGLGDVSAWLPQAIRRAGVDIRYLVPAFPSILRAFSELRPAHRFENKFRAKEIIVYRGSLRGNPVKFYLIDAPELFMRAGNPYSDAAGGAWGDNHLRYACLSWVAAEFAEAGIDGWTPDVIHANDWMSALAPAYLELIRRKNPEARTSSVLSIHNLAFQGVFPFSTYGDLELPNYFFNEDGAEFYRQVSFIKAGIMFADKIATVSPAYAAEIQTEEYGCGLADALIRRKDSLTGILNGVDYEEWNPASDRHIRKKYSKDTIADKKANKEFLQAKAGLLRNPKAPLFGVLSRMTEQKGMDLIIESIPALMANGVQLLVMGTDQGNYMPRLSNIARQYPGQFAAMDYDEAFSHQVIAGIDVLANPARFEPCGLTQMFAMRYGTIPYARRTGGLSDTIIDANFQNTVASSAATGFLFENYRMADFIHGTGRILSVYRNEKKIWEALKRQAMKQNFSWDKAASAYIDLYNTQLNLIK